MKKILLLLILMVIPFNIYALDIKSKNAILYNMNEDKVIYELKPDEKVYIASMTKIMTALISLEKIDDINKKITMTTPMFYRLIEENASTAGFQVGEVVTYEDLLYGLMLPSGADAAQGLAVSLYGDIDTFVEAMNKKVNELGLKNTHFSNPTGLDSKDNYSTVRDVAIILKEALKNSNFKKIFSADKYVTSNKKHIFTSTRNKYNMDTSFIDGSKTGFTYDAGLCMASTSHYNNVNYLLVTAHAPYDNRTNHLIDAKTIYKYYQNNYEYRKVLEPGEKITTIKLNDESIDYYTNKKIDKYLSKKCNISKEYIGIDTIDSDYDINNKLGEYIVKCDDEVLYKEDIYMVLRKGIEKKFDYKIIIYALSSLVILLTLILLGIKIKRKKV